MKIERIGNVLRSDHTAGYLFVLPWLIGFAGFTMLPLCASLYLSFTKYDVLSPPVWIGIDNYKAMLHDDRFWKSIKVTFIYVFTAIPLKLAFALSIALLLNAKFKMMGLYRSLYYLPTIMGGSVAVAIMWRQLFGLEGALNSFLAVFGAVGEKQSWVMNPSTSLWTLVLLGVWQFGSSMLIFLAGLKQIPTGLYEAAIIDGSNWFQRLFRITLPLLTPVIFFNLIMQIISGFKVFTEGLIVTGGGPMDSTLFYALYLYEKSFTSFDMGFGSAMAWVLLLIIAFFTAIVFKSSAGWVHYESKGE
ncbi:carbohydrate ABC transporter permease [Paenibacillus thalictri]|uniref:Sugar ABC transporter permease n=1 Tax=Paenibacillus thalictri TaxID=2527873 RepID=A0A4Q9E2E6_9BACL|nr:sugar ABC transporter permease [Paenibacillus thalictri]TBL81811.1 sugar ABC transporter permease [Paenibacillus thalictri]